MVDNGRFQASLKPDFYSVIILDWGRLNYLQTSAFLSGFVAFSLFLFTCLLLMFGMC